MGVLAYTHALLHAAVDEQSHVLTFTELRHGSEGCSFHFKQVLFRSMLTWLRYRCDGWTDRQTDGFSALYVTRFNKTDRIVFREIPN